MSTTEEQKLYLQTVTKCLDKAERYLLLSLASSAVFAALSLAEPVRTAGARLEYRLLGFPLSIDPVLAIVVAFVLSLGVLTVFGLVKLHPRFGGNLVVEGIAYVLATAYVGLWLEFARSRRLGSPVR